MSFRRTFRVILASVGYFGLCGWLGLAGCETVGPSTGHGLVDLPDTPPLARDVLDASAAVITQRYPMSSVSERGGYVYALTPVTMEANSKSRKQISVVVVRNFTGAFEPVVRVRQFIEVGDPEIGTNPESANLVEAMPLAHNKWQALDYLPVEEQAIYDAILKKLASVAPPPQPSPPPAAPPPDAAASSGPTPTTSSAGNSAGGP